MGWKFYDANGVESIAQLGTVAITAGGTGAITAAAALTALGVGTASSPAFVDLTLTDDLLLTSSDAVINFNSGDMTITHSSNTLTIAGGILAAPTGSTIGNLTLANGSITDSGGAIDFGNETLTTTGTLAAGTTTIGSLVVAAASITDTSGAITFGDENLTTTGTISAGNLTVTGTTTTVNSSVLTVVDPIIHLQTASGGGNLSSDTNKDVGLMMEYFSGSAKQAFLGFDDSAAKLTFIPDATLSSEVVSGSIGTIVANLEGAVTGNVDGDASGSALTVTQAAQTAITSVGTLTALGVTNAVTAGSLDINGVADISGAVDLHATLDMNTNDIDNIRSATFITEVNNGDSGSSDTIDWGAAQKQRSTLTGNCTFTFTAPDGPCNLMLKCINDGTVRTITWPNTVKWPAATAPTFSGSSLVDVIAFYYDGTNYYGQATLAFPA